MAPRLRRFLAARLDRASYLGLHLTVGLGVALGGLWAFGALLEEVLDAERLVRWDEAASRWVHAHTSPAGLRVMHAVTTLGAPTTMAALALGGAVVLFRQRRRTTLVTWLAAFGGGMLLDALLKYAVRRPRPPFGARYLHGHSYSFPSGHAMGAIVGYAMLLHLLRGRRTWRRATAVAATAAAAALVLFVGVSRVYLGVHYPSDVVGGLLAGAAWLAVCLTGESIAEGRAGGDVSRQ
ncbi:MAG: phosphatase PAP2 family protein [Gemmatirosa sp.]|nr:phosphatase PAP2 family protein [Gemmatirosa sp.]